jgi:hypothetical protein
MAGEHHGGEGQQARAGDGDGVVGEADVGDGAAGRNTGLNS